MTLQVRFHRGRLVYLAVRFGIAHCSRVRCTFYRRISFSLWFSLGSDIEFLPDEINDRSFREGFPMRTVRLLSALMTIVFGLNIAACCGGTTIVEETKTQVTNPGTGHELQDLDNAYKNGAITKEEYDKLRQDIMSKVARTPQ